MPTTPDEAKLLMELASEVVSPLTLYKLMGKYEMAVGASTHNDSVRETMTMLRLAAGEMVLDEAMGLNRKGIDYSYRPLFGLLFMVIVFAHFVYVAAATVSMFFIPFCVPWFVAVPLMAVPPALAFSPGRCPLTMLENRVRDRLGLPQIHGFLNHYLLRDLL